MKTYGEVGNEDGGKNLLMTGIKDGGMEGYGVAGRHSLPRVDAIPIINHKS